MTKEIKKLDIAIGETYRNRKGEEGNTIYSLVPETDSRYNRGFRFFDENARCYRPDGTYDLFGEESSLDLVEKIG